jgi:hypothetical protein
MHNTCSLPFSPIEHVAADGCIVFDKHICLRCVRKEALPPCSSTMFLAMGASCFPFRERITDHTWDKLVLPFMDSMKVHQLFCLAHLIRLQTSRQASNHCFLFLPIVHLKRLHLFMAQKSSNIVQSPESKQSPHVSWKPQV